MCRLCACAISKSLKDLGTLNDCSMQKLLHIAQRERERERERERDLFGNVNNEKLEQNNFAMTER